MMADTDRYLYHDFFLIFLIFLLSFESHTFLRQLRYRSSRSARRVMVMFYISLRDKKTLKEGERLIKVG